MFITPEKLAEVLAELFPHIVIDDLLRSDSTPSYKSENSIWQQACSHFLSTHCDRTIKKHSRKLYDTFNNHFDAVKTCFLELTALKNEPSISPISDNFITGNFSPISEVKKEPSISPISDGYIPENFSPISKVKKEPSISSVFDHYVPQDLSPISEVIHPKSVQDDFLGNDTESFRTESCSKNAAIQLCVKKKQIISCNATERYTESNKAIIQDGTILFPREFWERFLATDAIRLKKGWCEEFNKYFKVQYPHCVLAFQWHKCYLRKPPYFYAVAKCKNTSCAYFRFEVVTPIIQPFHNIEVQIYRNKKISHASGEIHRRFIRESERQVIRRELEGQAPSALKLKMLGNVAEDILVSGNRNDAPSLMLLQKMSSENHTRDDLAKDMTEFLQKLTKQFKDSWPGRFCNGYIQGHCIEPFYLILFTEQQILYLLSVQKPVFCNLDATGSIVARPSDVAKPIYYYALIVPGDDECAPLPIAEFISSTHNIPYISAFLSIFNHTLRRMTSRRKVIDKIETDFSLTLIQSVLKAFNDMSLMQYLTILYTAINDNHAVVPEFTRVHICSTHVLRTVIRKVKNLFRHEEQRTLCAALITRLIHCESLITAEAVFRVAVIVFDSEEKCNDFDRIVADMKNTERGLNCALKVDTTPEQLDIESSEKDAKATHLLRHGSPFYTFFKSVRDNEKEKFCIATYTRKNEYYCPEFIAYLLEHLLPFFPLWSSFTLIEFGLSRDSNANVENWFKIVKKDIFNRNLGISAPRFVQKMESYLKPRLRERRFSLKTERQRRNNTNNLELQEEMWLKKNKSQTYFKFAKYTKQRKDVIENVQSNPLDLKNEKLGDADVTKILLPVSNSRGVNDGKTLIFTSSHTTDDPESLDGMVVDTLCHEKSLELHIADSRDIDIKSLFSPSLTYPVDFPHNPANIAFAGILFTEHSLRTLLPGEWLDDNIVNGFCVLAQDLANGDGLKVLAFESFFTEKLLQGAISIGFQRWAEMKDIWAYDVWLLPVHYGNHWTLLVVVFPHNVFLYVDSMHGKPPAGLIDGLCAFIESYRVARSKKITRWQNWSFSIPSDVPLQTSAAKNPNSFGNCGVHVCSWVYTLCRSSFYSSSEDDMNTARKGIARWLLKKREPQKRAARYKMREIILEAQINCLERTKSKKIVRTCDPPLGFQTTLEYCATLKVLLEAGK